MVAILSVGSARPLMLRPREGAPRAAGSRSDTATSSSWVAHVNAPGTTPFPRPRGRRAAHLDPVPRARRSLVGRALCVWRRG